MLGVYWQEWHYNPSISIILTRFDSINVINKKNHITYQKANNRRYKCHSHNPRTVVANFITAFVCYKQLKYGLHPLYKRNGHRSLFQVKHYKQVKYGKMQYAQLQKVYDAAHHRMAYFRIHDWKMSAIHIKVAEFSFKIRIKTFVCSLNLHQS